MRLALLALLCACAARADWAHLDPTKLQTMTPPETQRDAALQIIQDVYQSENKENVVQVEVDPSLFVDKKDSFRLQRSGGGPLRVRASSGVAAVWGFHHYLKEYLRSHVGWQARRVDTLAPFVDVNETVVANDRFRYYQNVCTASYSFVWWGPRQWTAHVAWMALNGVNLALAPVAAEAAWTRVYRALGLTAAEIDEHFTGPAFLAWQRMGNVRHWGGPLRAGWHRRARAVAAAVVPLMRRLGMVPALPAFAGHVPRALARVFPNSSMLSVDAWNGFGAADCCGLFVAPRDPLFRRVGGAFLRELRADVGEYSHVFAADPFNEVAVRPWSTALVRDAASAIFATITEADPDAVWLLQNWMFVHDPLLWGEERVRALLTAAPPGRALVLDLQAEQWPQYSLYRMYYGQPFVWCMLHNFGGTLGMFGSLSVVGAAPHAARALPGSTMLGVGLTPEGINQNYVVYDLMLEAAWRRRPAALGGWVERYAARRYGCDAAARAWRHLAAGVYDFDGLNRVRGKYVPTRRPSFRLEPWAWYNSSGLMAAWRGFVDAADEPRCASDGFRHDIVDVTRQALQYRAEQLYIRVRGARAGGVFALNATAAVFVDALEDMQRVLSCHGDFTAAAWLAAAREIGDTEEESDRYEFNARNQITLWGPNGEISDYANKQWAELFRYYYVPRWRLFLGAAVTAAARGEPFDERAVQDVIRETVEREFASVTIETPSCGQDLYDVVRELYDKWSVLPGAEDLPMRVVPRPPRPAPRPAERQPEVVMLTTRQWSTTLN